MKRAALRHKLTSLPRFLQTELVHLPAILLLSLVTSALFPDTITPTTAATATLLLTILANWTSRAGTLATLLLAVLCAYFGLN